MSLQSTTRLAIIVSHPIQYYSPWFAYLAKNLGLTLKVFYLSSAGSTPQYDPGFQQSISWDINLLSGYDYAFLPNKARHPSISHFFGLNHPSTVEDILAWKPDILLLFNYPYLTHLRIITSPRLRHIPLIFRGDSHLLAENLPFWKKALKRLVLRLLFQRFQAFLAVGKANTTYFVHHGVQPNKIFLSPHAVDNDRFTSALVTANEEARTWKKSLNIPDHHAVVLFAGKFEEKKRPQDLLQAFLLADLRDTTLVFVGSGHLEKALKTQAASHAQIRFVPFQNQSHMPLVYALADVLVLPSFGPGETWGLAVNEAFCLAKAVIVSDHVGCQRDLVHSEKTGLVFPAKNIPALCQALQEALSDRERLAQWGKNGQELILSYSYQQTTTGLENALHFILNQK